MYSGKTGVALFCRMNWEQQPDWTDRNKLDRSRRKVGAKRIHLVSHQLSARTVNMGCHCASLRLGPFLSSACTSSFLSSFTVERGRNPTIAPGISVSRTLIHFPPVFVGRDAFVLATFNPFRTEERLPLIRTGGVFA